MFISELRSKQTTKKQDAMAGHPQTEQFADYLLNGGKIFKKHHIDNF